jgi:hypothetical protein
MITRWWRQYNAATAQTRYFVLNWIVYGLALIVTTVYCYARLDFVRSYKTPAIEEQSAEKTIKPGTE